MSTYLNCHELLKEVRYGIDDFSEEKTKGTDTTGAFQNDYLVRKINSAQDDIYALLLNRIPNVFLESASLTPTSSVYTLPSDFGTLLVFKDDRGRQVYPVDIDALKQGDAVGNDRLYYRKGNTLVLDKDGVTDVYTLWYLRKPRYLDQGIAVSGTASQITLANTAPITVDYYNGMTIENVTQDWSSTISDYNTNRDATVVGTAVADDYYGIVSDLPTEFHYLIAQKAILEIKAQSPVTKVPPSPLELQFYNEKLNNAISAYTGNRDIDSEDIWSDFSGDGFYYYY